MLTLAAPLWLIGLLAVPLIRWLHRSGPHLRTVAVSHLGLWKDAAASRAAAGEARPPDPAWRRRALLAALLVFALSGPRMLEQAPRIVVWVDDSLSMLAREATATRLDEGLAQVRAAIDAAAPGEVEVRTLGDPWRNLGALTDATRRAIVQGAGKAVPAAPPAALVRRDSLHWLLSDATEAKAFDWKGSAGPDRLFRVGTLTRNAGLERLAARRSLADPARIDVLLKVTNGGNAPETRTLEIVTEAGDIATSEAVIAAGTSVLVSARFPETTRIRAMLKPGDALAQDDAIELTLEALRRLRIAVDPRCPRALHAALRAHPALVAVAPQASDIDATVECGPSAANAPVPALRVIADTLPEKPAGTLRWSIATPASLRSGVDEASMGVAGRIERRRGDSIVLAAGDVPLIVARAGKPRVVETVLDFDAPANRQQHLPLLVNLLFEQLLGLRLLDATTAVDRGPDAINVVAGAPDAATASGRDSPIDAAARDLNKPFLLAALIVLIWEMLALAAQWRRLRDPATGVT